MGEKLHLIVRLLPWLRPDSLMPRHRPTTTDHLSRRACCRRSRPTDDWQASPFQPTSTRTSGRSCWLPPRSRHRPTPVAAWTTRDARALPSPTRPARTACTLRIPGPAHRPPSFPCRHLSSRAVRCCAARARRQRFRTRTDGTRAGRRRVVRSLHRSSRNSSNGSRIPCRLGCQHSSPYSRRQLRNRLPTSGSRPSLATTPRPTCWSIQWTPRIPPGVTATSQSGERTVPSRPASLLDVREHQKAGHDLRLR
jgi:hypothetical protein